MKSSRKIFFSSLLLVAAGIQFAFSGCVAEVDSGVYYGPRRDPWFNDGPWMDGHRGYYDRGGGRADVYISPPRISLPAPPGIHIH